MLPRFPPLVPVDPELILILAFIGAMVGAVSTVTTYIAFRNAEAAGTEYRVLPEFLPLIQQRGGIQDDDPRRANSPAG